MALSHRIEALRKKHADIDNKLRQEELHPSNDSAFVNQLKVRKLGLKDEIERLLQGQEAAS